MGAQHGFNYTALRPQLVTGPTPGALNVVPAIGVYAAIRREKGEPFGFPGGPSFVWEAADADLVADVMVWAAQSPQAANEAFNITNGDVFEWRNVWPAMAESLGADTGPDMPTSVAAYLDENADVWNRIVAKYDLRSRNLRELVGQGDQHADFAFAYGAPEGPRAFVSTVKLRQAGFAKTIDTEGSETASRLFAETCRISVISIAFMKESSKRRERSISWLLTPASSIRSHSSTRRKRTSTGPSVSTCADFSSQSKRRFLFSAKA